MTTTTDVATAVVTMLFSDIEGSTKLVQTLGPEWPDTLATHRRILRAAWAQHGGAEQGTEGDSFFVIFPDAGSAIAAAVEAQRGLALQQWPRDAAVRVRIGIHTGEVFSTGDSLVGIAIHEAARIGAAAHGGQILVSSETVGGVGGMHAAIGWAYDDLGEHHLKDIPDARRLFQVRADGLLSEFPPPRTRGSGANNLPAMTTTFVGREQEVPEVLDLVSASRLVTITGAGGAGKTRLAIRVAAELAPRFPAGIWLVELGALADATAVTAAIGSVVGAPAATTWEALADEIGDDTILLLLDNCEHLVAEVASIVDPLLSRCHGLHVMTTSREPLGLPGEVSWRLPSLSIESGVALFEERARAVNRAFAVTPENREVVERLVTRLDGIPLALELAAARAQSLSVDQIDQRLDQRFRLLTGGSRTALERQRTLLATVDWSYVLLGPDEQVLLRRLGVFVGGFTLAAAERVCAWDPIDEFDVVDLLGALVTKSLVVAEQAGADVRYRLLETIRQYAADRLESAGEMEEARGRHLGWVRGLAADARPFVWASAEEAAWLDDLAAEHENIRVALDWAGAIDPGAAVFVCGAVAPMWLRRDHRSEALERMRRVDAECDIGKAGDAVYFLFGLTLLATDAADLELARETAARGVEIVQALEADDPARWLAPNLEVMHALCCAGHSGAAEAVRRAEDAVAAARSASDAAMAITFTAATGLFATSGQVARAAELAGEAVEVCRRAGGAHTLLRALAQAGRIALMRDDHARARALNDELLQAARASGDYPMVRHGLLVGGYIESASGDNDRAFALMLEAERETRAKGTKTELAQVLQGAGWIALERGDHGMAVMKTHEALDLYRAATERDPRAWSGVSGSLHTLAEVARSDGDLSAACAHLQSALEAAAHTVVTNAIVDGPTVETIGGLAAAVGEGEMAATLLGAAEKQTNVWAGLAREIADRDRRAAEAAVADSERFSTAWARGRELPVDEVLGLAREALDRIAASLGDGAGVSERLRPE